MGQRVNGIFIKPFIATDGFYTFASTDESEGFLTELLEEIRNESLVLMELAKSRGVGLDVPITDEGEESSGQLFFWTGSQASDAVKQRAATERRQR